MNSAAFQKVLPTSPVITRQKRCSLHAKKREKAKNYWLVNISWWLGRFIKNEEIKFETWTFLDDLVDLSRMRRLSSKQNERMMIEHASRCVFVFYDLMKLLCEFLLFKLHCNSGYWILEWQRNLVSVITRLLETILATQFCTACCSSFRELFSPHKLYIR